MGEIVEFRLITDGQRFKDWLDVHGTDLHRYGLSARRRVIEF